MKVESRFVERSGLRLSVKLVVNFDWLNGAVLKLLSEELLVQRRN